MDLGEHLVYGTARVAMALYFATLYALLLVGGDDRLARARRLWTLGYLCYLAHVAAAFHFVYHWSHAEAAAATDFQAELDTGLPIPGGIYFNYAFTVVWTLDVAWWWLAPKNYSRRSQTLSSILHAFLFFMAVNATIIFGQGLTRWLSAAACVGLLIATAFRSRRSSVA